MIHLAESWTFFAANASLPLMVRPPRAGGVTSRMTVVFAGIVTSSPAAGTRPVGHVLARDQRRSAAWLGAANASINTATHAGNQTREYFIPAPTAQSQPKGAHAELTSSGYVDHVHKEALVSCSGTFKRRARSAAAEPHSAYLP